MGEAEIGIRLHGEGATKAGNLNELLGELGKIDAQPGREKGDFYPLALPVAEDFTQEEDLAAARTHIRDKILTLFGNLLITFSAGDRTPMMQEGFQINLGEASQHFDVGDLNSVLSDVSRLMDPTDPDFNSAVADRVTGVINILRAAAETAGRYLDPKGVFAYLRRISDDVMIGGERKKITEITWEADEDEAAAGDQPSRKRILDARFKSMLAARLRIENGKLYAALCERLPGNKKTLNELRKVFIQGATQLRLTDYWVAQLSYNLYAAIYTHVGKMTQPVFEAIGVLINEMGGATLKGNPKEFAAAIEKFKAETLPALVTVDPTMTPQQAAPAK